MKNLETAAHSQGLSDDTDSFHTVKEIGLTGLQYSFGLNGEGIDLREKSNREIFRATVAETGVSIASLKMAILNKVPYSTHDDSLQIVVDCLVIFPIEGK